MKVRVWFRNQCPLFPSALLLILIISVNTFAQSEATAASRNTIQGDIILPNGQRLDRPVMVWLTTSRGELSTTSNGNGSFVFRQLGGGRFVVRVDAGENFEAASEVVSIADTGSTTADARSAGMSRLGQIYSVQIHLRPKAGQPITKGVVSANEPVEAVELYNQALESVKAGDRDKAIEQLKRALAIHPQFVAALNGLGVQYMKLGNYQHAFEAFNSALLFSPDNFTLHLNCGISLFQLGKFAEAEKELSTALLKTETSGPAHVYRGRALIALKRFDEAAKDLKRAIEIGGDDVKLAHRYLAGIYVEKGENAEAVKQLELYLKASPSSKETDQIKNLIKELNKKAGRE